MNVHFLKYKTNMVSIILFILRPIGKKFLTTLKKKLLKKNKKKSELIKKNSQNVLSFGKTSALLEMASIFF